MSAASGLVAGVAVVMLVPAQGGGLFQIQAAEWAAAAVLGVLLAMGVLRIGPRAWVEAMGQGDPGGHEHHDEP